MHLEYSTVKPSWRLPWRRLVGLHKGAGKWRTGPIGLEFGHTQLCLVQLQYGRGGIRIRAAVSQALAVDRQTLFAEPARLKASLQAALSHSAFKGRRVVTCLPPDQMKLKMFRYQVAVGGNEAQTVMEQVLDQVEGGAADWVVDYMPLRQPTADAVDRASLVAFARRIVVQDYLELLRVVGLDVRALEIGPVVIRRLITAVQQHQEPAVNSLVINLGLNNTFLTMISGQRLILDRDIDFAELALIDKLARVLEIDTQRARRMLYQYGFHDQDPGSAQVHARHDQITNTLSEIMKPEFRQLISEIDKVLSYVASQSHGSGIDRVYLLGGIARWPGIDDYLAGLLNVPVKVLDPLRQLTATGQARADHCGDAQDCIAAATYALATGCALRGLLEQ